MSHPSRPKSVLVVEDDIQMLLALERRLSRSGFQVVTATNGAEALERVQCCSPDAITLDVRLPDRDGFEIASILRADPQIRSIPIIFVTGKVDSNVKEFCRRISAGYFIRKPYDPLLLVRLLKSVLAQDELAELERVSLAKRRQPFGVSANR